MATPEVRNVVVGAANVFYSASWGSSRAGDPSGSFESASSAATSLRSKDGLPWVPASGSGSWIEAGLTTEGVDMSYEPNYGEVTVDQLLDVAKIFKQSLRVTLKTSFAEATLGNMEIAFGNAATVQYSASSASLALAAGALGAEPVERSLVFVSQSAPQGAVWGDSGSALPGSHNTERVYFARRVVSMDTVGHGLKRDSATFFPVTFRCLPDTSFDGSEYGKVIDRLYTGPAFTG